MSREDLRGLVDAAQESDLLGLIGDLEAAKAAAWTRLAAQPKVISPGEDHLLSLPDVAKILGVPEDRAYDLARQRRLPVVVIGKYRRVRESALRAFIAASEVCAGPGRGLRRAG